jgi:hypothetical protein
VRRAASLGIASEAQRLAVWVAACGMLSLAAALAGVAGLAAGVVALVGGSRARSKR